MSNFDSLIHQVLPPDLLMTILKTYRYFGNHFEDKIKNNIDQISSDNLEKETFFVCSLMGINLSEQRLRILINKEGTPKNKEEFKIQSIKNVLASLHKLSEEYSLNASDLLEFVNQIEGKGYARYQTSPYNVVKKDKNRSPSPRYLFDCVLDEYNTFFNRHKYEKVILGILTYVELINIKPFTAGNQLAAVLFLYYSILRSGSSCYKYVSFFGKYYEVRDQINKAVIEASINYDNNIVRLTTLSSVIFNMINESYQELEQFVNDYRHFEALGKSALVEKTILQMEGVFTKDDIRQANPYVSEVTINRVLNKLREQNYIQPLGTGRSAKWIRNPEKDTKISKLIN